MKKYYYIKYNMKSGISENKISNHQCVSDEHPFEWLKLKNKLLPSFPPSELVEWKEISEKEYLSGKEVIGIG